MRIQESKDRRGELQDIDPRLCHLVRAIASNTAHLIWFFDSRLLRLLYCVIRDHTITVLALREAFAT
jgi:hypothetical protein